MMKEKIFELKLYLAKKDMWLILAFFLFPDMSLQFLIPGLLHRLTSTTGKAIFCLFGLIVTHPFFIYVGSYLRMVLLSEFPQVFFLVLNYYNLTPLISVHKTKRTACYQ